MDPVSLFAIINAALAVAKEAADVYERWTKGGGITQEEFDRLAAKSDDLHAEMARRRAERQ